MLISITISGHDKVQRARPTLVTTITGCFQLCGRDPHKGFLEVEIQHHGFYEQLNWNAVKDSLYDELESTILKRK